MTYSSSGIAASQRLKAHMHQSRVSEVLHPWTMLPTPPLALRYFARGASLWLVARVLGSVAVALAGGDPLHLTFGATLLIIAASVLIGVADMRRRHERALLENLAVSTGMRVAFFAIPALAGEISIGVVAGVLA